MFYGGGNLWGEPYPAYSSDNNGYWGGWGRTRGRKRYGSWGGWARPHHRFRQYGWGGWSEPRYGGAGGYASENFASHSVDAQGGLYHSAGYSYVPAQTNNYSWPSANAVSQEETEPDKAANKVEYKTRYRLGPDADIINNGYIAFHLTENAYLLMQPDMIAVVDKSSGYPAMALYPDEVLSWHLIQEIDQQCLGLESRMKQKGTLLNSPSVKNSQEKTRALYKEINNLDSTIGLLHNAKNRLGQLPREAPNPVKPPVKEAFEIFASTWMTKDGTLIISRLNDGSYIYLDGKGIYKDVNKTKLDKSYPGIFKKVVSQYLQKLIKESKSITKNLKDDNEDALWAIEHLKAELLEQSKKTEKKDDEDSRDNQKQKTNKENEKTKNKKNQKLRAKLDMNQAINRSEHRLHAISKQIESMPDEVAAAKKMLKVLNKQ